MKLFMTIPEKLRLIIENSTNLFYVHNEEHELTYLSPQCRDFLQCEPEEAMHHWTEFATDNPLNQKGFQLTQKAISTGQRQPPYPLELRGKAVAPKPYSMRTLKKIVSRLLEDV